MKRLLALCIVISLVACKEEPKDYATLSGKIENAHESKTLKIFKGKEFEKIIKLEDDGTFNDTLKIDAGDYTIQHGSQFGQIYLENDNETTINTDYEDFTNSIVFGGDASDVNNFSVQSFLISNDHFTEDLITNGTKEDLDAAIENYRSAYNELKLKYTEVDSTRVSQMDKNIEGSIKQISQYLSSKFAMRSQFPQGMTSPTFTNYENFAGGEMSLKDLRGKYVYIDVWATWCGPCIREIPALKQVEKQYHDKNIAFVSISVDNGRGYKGDAEAAHQGWKKMVAEKDLGGIQLYADNGFSSEFIQDYKINAIPRFILIDPQGNIVTADAPRPSNQQLVKLFDKLNI
ncbi:MAG: TlpA family protein disulfide reductase [Winogradskyella sp.]|uniref:TlpA family protein disulfide reductase n=1 Tax=Winogradskyella sp. TaxID=1883156 RepID=UPI0018002B98|nr:TlpA family protein disulfide reductase [Winogradskyella sp.]